jgi:hypothetical protein
MPNPSAVELIHVKDREGAGRVEEFLREGGWASSPLVSQPQGNTAARDEYGGLDFSDTQNIVEFQQKNLSARGDIAPAIPNTLSSPLQLLKGFDFRILGIQPFGN